MKTPAHRLRIGIFGLLWGAVSLAALAAPGCYGRNCEGTTEVFGANDGNGQMVDPNTWESTAFNAEWLPFPRQRVWVIDAPVLGGRMPVNVMTYISASPNPGVSGDFTIGSGNLAKQMVVRPNGVNVYNDTCSDYFLRVVIEVPPLPPELEADSGSIAEPDASAPDASGETLDAGDGG